ncbi:hypothetical protein F0562_000273 [Nyssa sinensis]|uniref:RING-type E3 ubiquitin transferase n=1 Tax=Nyssa sinensis TaxID=561372 RepID=A0A5J5C051_9ASTE|nr:hypothetical protein F0562_000273 [Nyssa sinensis]
MGITWSSNRRRNNNYYQNPHPPPHLLSSSSSSSSSSYSYPAEPYPAPSPYPYSTHHPPPLAGPPPPLRPPGPPPPPPPIYSSYYNSGGYSACNYANPIMGRSNFGPHYAYQNNGWAGIRPPPVVGPPPLPPLPPPPYVDHQQAKKVRNDVNVHKDTLRLEVDEQNPDHYLVSFVFDALLDGSITVFYFAKEESTCKFAPLFPEAFMPVKIPFQKGLGQKFRQPSGTGIDLGFFTLEDLSKQSTGEDVFPLVISAETGSPLPTDEHLSNPPPNASPHMQITQAVIEKNNEDPFQVRVIRQILWIDGVRYELREIYGIRNSSAESFNDNDSGKECVICMTEPKDTAVLPCRHMCMCSECAKALRLQSNKCPICRQSIDELLEIKTCVLKVNIHCDGCKHKVKKILQKIDGVYTTHIDSDQGKVTVSGNVDPNTLIKKLAKSGKHAELWGAPKASNNHQQNQLNNQFKNMQLDNGKGGSNKGQKGGNNQPKGGQQGQNPQQLQQQQQQHLQQLQQQQQHLQQLQQLQQMKGFPDLKLPQLKDLKMPPFNGNQNQNQKTVKFNLPEEDDLSDYDYDDDDEFDDEFDDEMDDIPHQPPPNKMKPNGQGGGAQNQMANMMMNAMMNGQHPHLMNAQAKGGNGGNNGANSGGNGKKGGAGGGNIPIQMLKMVEVRTRMLTMVVVVVAAAAAANGGKKMGGMNDGVHGMPNISHGYHNMGVNPGANMGQMPMGQMGQMPMGPMGNIPAVQGLPAAAMNAGGGGYFQGAGAEIGNPYYQQQLAAMMMNQQRANGNERFHPMMYARQPPAVNYMPPPYQYMPPADPYTHYFSDENTSSCNVM